MEMIDPFKRERMILKGITCVHIACTLKILKYFGKIMDKMLRF